MIFKSIFCKQYTVWILIFLVGNNLRTAFGNNCISNQPNVTYYYDGNNENAEFDLPSCSFIQAPEILLYLGGSGQIKFNTQEIFGNIKIYAQTSDPTYQLMFPYLTSVNGTLNFMDDASSAMMQAPIFSCWGSPDGSLDTVVNSNGIATYPSDLYLGSLTGLTIEGTLKLEVDKSMGFNSSSMNLFLLGGLLVTSQSADFSFPNVETIDTIQLITAHASLSFPWLKAISNFTMVNSDFGSGEMTASDLEAFNSSSEVLNIQNSQGNAVFGSVNLNMADEPACNCAQSSLGFPGCDDFCSSQYPVTQVSCYLAPPTDDDDIAKALAALFLAILIASLVICVCCACAWLCIIGTGATAIAGIFWCCFKRDKQQDQDVLNLAAQQNTVSPIQASGPTHSSGQGDFRTRGTQPQQEQLPQETPSIANSSAAPQIDRIPPSQV